MTSEEVLAVIEDLGNRFGVAIDWTSNNVIPKVQEICERLITYKIVVHSLGIALNVALMVIAICFVSKILHSRNEVIQTNNSNMYWDCYCNYNDTYDINMSELGFIILIVSAILGISAAVALVFQIVNLLNWVVVPEVELFYMLQSCLGTV